MKMKMMTMTTLIQAAMMMSKKDRGINGARVDDKNKEAADSEDEGKEYKIGVCEDSQLTSCISSSSKRAEWKLRYQVPERR